MNAPTAGWNPDPTGRHEYRYWDGGAWTDDVSDNGVTSVDPVDGPAPFGAEPTSSFDPTQQYAPQPGPPTGPPVGGYGAQPGPYGPQPGAPGYDPYGSSGQVPPGQPVKSGPPTGLIIGLVAVAVAVIVGLVVVLTGGDDDDTATDDTTTTTAEPTDDTTATTTATTTTEDTTGDTVGPEDADVFTLAIGDCLVEDSSGGEVQEVPVVPCDQPHASEVYYSHIIDGDELPDATEMETIAGDVCVANFESYVGLPYPESVFVYTVLQPTQGSWDSGDRELLCLLADPAGEMTGSAAGSNR